MDALERGREAYRRREWAHAYAFLSEANAETDGDPASHGAGASLTPEDLERLATAAILLGKNEEGEELRARAYHALAALGDNAGAARMAFWTGFGLMQRGEAVLGGGWLARAQRHVEDHGAECVEQGYLLVPAALMSIGARDAATALATWEQAWKIASRFGDPDLTVMSQLGRGQSLIWLGDTTAGLAFLDEVMVAVTAGEVSPIVAGIVYCASIEACQEILDVRRAQEWTAALTRWCEAQPDLVPFRGRCLVHRSEILQLSGSWREAVEEARRACELLADPSRPPWELGAAFYQQAELHRVRGELAKAEDAYRRASQRGRDPQPGLALLRLAQGQVETAESAVRRLVDETRDRVLRSRILPAYVEIVLAVDDVGAARTAAAELGETAADFDVPLLHAVASQAQGAVLLSEGNARAALPKLRESWTAWQELAVPYEAAKVRVLIGLAYRQLGDEDGAEMELDAARWVFQQLGAEPDLTRVEALSRKAAPKVAGGLTVREVEVLRLIAAGKTNRAIAEDLVISQKTVARHVSNIFTKLGLSTRAAATAYAYENDLV